MRKILLGAAVLALASVAVPANAGGLFFFSDLCKQGPNGSFQRQCASNNLSLANNSSQDIKQQQGGKGKDTFYINGLVQSQKGSNLKFFGQGGFQGINQSQYLKLKNSTANGGKWSPTQSQNADNINFGGSGDQNITQSQKLVAINTDLNGTQQSQSATNVNLGGQGNSQSITQTQSFEFVGVGCINNECPGSGGD